MGTMIDKFTRQQSLFNPLLMPVKTAEDGVDEPTVETPEERIQRLTKAVQDRTRSRLNYKHGAPLGKPFKPRNLSQHNKGRGEKETFQQ